MNHKRSKGKRNNHEQWVPMWTFVIVSGLLFITSRFRELKFEYDDDFVWTYIAYVTCVNHIHMSYNICCTEIVKDLISPYKLLTDKQIIYKEKKRQTWEGQQR